MIADIALQSCFNKISGCLPRVPQGGGFELTRSDEATTDVVIPCLQLDLQSAYGLVVRLNANQCAEQKFEPSPRWKMN